MPIQIVEVNTQAGLARVFPVMNALRTELLFQDYLSIYEQARAANCYTLVGAFVDDDQCVGLMGYRILHDYVHGKHIYVDDLVTVESFRSKGIGSQLLAFAEQEARRLACSNLRLSTGIANTGGKKFYEREGWQCRSVVYKKVADRILQVDRS